MRQKVQSIEARQRELKLLAESRAQADQQYVRDFAGFLFRRIIDRKLLMIDELPESQRRLLGTLRKLEEAA